MKKSELKTIIKEEYKTLTGKTLMNEESLATKIMYLFFAPKMKKDVAKIKKTPEFQELERQAKLAVKELEVITKKLERRYDDQQDVIKKVNKLGWKLKPWDNAQDLIKQVKK